uniref:Ras association domain family member 2b n=1 Tax=Electrophorus electricus TaxID=8005 RepID=A0AAY5EE84_ELEEL
MLCVAVCLKYSFISLTSAYTGKDGYCEPRHGADSKRQICQQVSLPKIFLPYQWSRVKEAFSVPVTQFGSLILFQFSCSLFSLFLGVHYSHISRPTTCIMKNKLSISGTERNQNINLIAPTIEVTGPVNQSKYSSRDVTGEKGEEVSSYVQRTRSDVGGKRLIGRSAPGVQRRIRRHRCSFNGHFYNHKTAVFTPAFGSVTNVRINSSMTTSQVLRVLLNKFKIENSPDEFSLFLLHTSGERVQLKRDEHPLLVRILQGPCEQVSKIFLMEPDQVEEVTYDVAQYIKLEMPILQSFISKLQEEENREMEKLKQRYCAMRTMIQKHMQRLANKVVG